MSIKPEFFGKYILLDKVAMGGMAEVYRAKAPGAEGIGKIIAIKRILPQFNTNHEFIEMFKSEAKIAINLTQGNIAQIYEFGEEHNLFFLAMEFIDGRNLRQILSRCSKLQRALTIEQCVYIIAQVANGLDYAHRCTNKNTGNTLNIIHRDMSPQNIMVSFDGEVKIIDFGIAKAESKIETTRAGILKGKFGYMSPEQAEGFDLDARTDIFSTGIVLWELLSGERLFVAHNEVNTIRKIRECQIPSLRKVNPNVHEELERITSKALAKDRNLRYQTAAELHRDLSRFLYKVNAEFTPHDLTLILKSLFKDDILEDRRKIIEFAKISFPNQKDEKTEVAHTDVSKTFTHTNDINSQVSLSKESSQDDVNNPVSKVDVPKSIILNENTSGNREIDFDIKVDRVELARQVMNPNKSNPTIVKTNTHARAPQSTQVGPHYNNYTQNYTNNRSYTGPFMKRSPIEAILSRVPKIVMSIAILSAAYMIFQYPQRFIGFGKRLVGIQNQTKMPSTGSKKGSDPKSSVGKAETARVFVRTIPAGASIVVDGETLGTTPAEIAVPMKTKVNVMLQRDGYLTYQKDFIATKQLEDIAATLQKASFGYLDIEVTPGNADIFVNGLKLVEKSPVRRYAVPSGKQLVVKAVNPYLNTSDEVSVSVKQDTVKAIKLFPRRTK